MTPFLLRIFSAYFPHIFTTRFIAASVQFFPMKPYSCALVWLRNDLRLHDNEALTKALRQATSVAPVFCFDPRQFGSTPFGFPKTGVHRERFLLESLADMRARLQERGGNLIARSGAPEEVLPRLAEELRAEALFFHEEVADEELRAEEAVSEALSRRGVKIHTFWGATLTHINDLPFEPEQTPDVFTQFRKLVEKKAGEPRPPLPTPERVNVPEGLSADFWGVIPQSVEKKSIGAQSVWSDAEAAKLPNILREFVAANDGKADARAVLPFRGGESAALERVEEYFWRRDELKRYKETRNGLLGADYSSKFSAWLALGCLSPRFVYAEVRRYERERVANDSTYWLVFELLWRDFFRFTALKHDTALFRPFGIQNAPKRWSQNWEAFNRWRAGMTGIPFIDAQMRELALTGFMSNRGRQNVASFLTRDLEVDWRMGAEWFESQLIDYDVCSNYGNWNYAAGIGNDPREDRYFNIMRQAAMYDTNGDYVRRWLPELRNVPPARIHAPHLASAEELRRYGCELGKDYPRPMLDLEKSAERFRRS
jgi:deoxyribodipyrimidine photo-lyase